MRIQSKITLLAALIYGPVARAEVPQPAPQPPQPAVSQPSTAPDPFMRLRRKIPKSELPPLQSVRIRNRIERASGRINIAVKSRPSGATVRHGRRTLGVTPLVLKAPRGSTPLDIVLKRRGYMTLRTRIHRLKSRSYFFGLSPAKH